ncbi:MAG: hypothetical protein NT136_01010 [Candidatus Moranbacteria bacterium]|nr:hypothetical protein [Candidatus Moranbacteria bacterium]
MVRLLKFAILKGLVLFHKAFLFIIDTHLVSSDPREVFLKSVKITVTTHIVNTTGNRIEEITIFNFIFYSPFFLVHQ